MRARKLRRTGGRLRLSCPRPNLRRNLRRCCGAESDARRIRRSHGTARISHRRSRLVLELMAQSQLARSSIAPKRKLLANSLRLVVRARRAERFRAGPSWTQTGLARRRISLELARRRSGLSGLRLACIGHYGLRCPQGSLHHSKVRLLAAGRNPTSTQLTCKESAQR